MARGIDITNDDILIDTSKNDILTKMLGNSKLYKGKDGLLYIEEKPNI